MSSRHEKEAERLIKGAVEGLHRPLTEPEELLIKAALSVFRPRKHGSIAEWIRAQKIRITSEQNSALAGTYFDPDQTPAVSRLLHSFMEPEGPDVANVMVIMKDSQSGITTGFAALFGWLVENRPGNLAYWTDTGANVYAAVDEKFRPFFEACAITRRAFEEREAQQRILKKTFPGMTATFMGAGSESSFKQRTLTYCVLDECAGHAPIHGQTTLDLAIARTTTEADAKVIAFSKPGACISTQTDEDGNVSITNGENNGDWFHAAYLAGTQEKYMVPCPHCGHFQEPRPESLRYGHCLEELKGGGKFWNLARIKAEAYLLCENEECAGKILDCHRKTMMLAGRWTPTPDEQREYKELFPTARPRYRSAQHSAFLSLFPNLSFGNLALIHKETLNSRSAERAFLNEQCGRPYTPERAKEMSSHMLLKKLIPVGVPGYRRLHLADEKRRNIRLPGILKDAPLIGLTCDVQKLHFKWILWAFRPVDDFLAERGEELRYYGVEAEPWCLDWGKSDSIERLDEIRGTMLELPDGSARGIDCMIMDTRTPAEVLLQICADRYPQILPVWGESEARSKSVKMGTAWQQPHAVKDGGNINVIHIDSSHWAEECRIRRIDQANLEAQSKASPPFRFPLDIFDDDSFMKEILNQTQIHKQDTDGRWKPVTWGPVVKMLKDDYFDCCKWAPLLWKACSSTLPVMSGWKP